MDLIILKYANYFKFKENKNQGGLTDFLLENDDRIY